MIAVGGNFFTLSTCPMASSWADRLFHVCAQARQLVVLLSKPIFFLLLCLLMHSGCLPQQLKELWGVHIG